MPFPTDNPSETEPEVPVRKPRRKRRRRRKRPRTSTHVYDEDADHPQPAAVRYHEPLQEPQEPDYAEAAAGYVPRRRPVKRRRRPIQRRPLVEGTDEENVLPRRKLVRRPIGFGNNTRNEEVKQWDPITTTEETRWKPVRTTTTETATTISTEPAKIVTTAGTITTAAPKTTFSTQKFAEDNNNNTSNHHNHVKGVGSSTAKITNSSQADIVVLHKRPINSKLPPTSAVIRRRLKPQNATSEETTTVAATVKPKIIVIKEELPVSLLPPGFKMAAETVNANQQNQSIANDSEDYRFNDEALTKMMKEQPNDKNNEFKFKSDSIPKVKDEILSLLKTKTGSSLLLNVLNLRNMSLEELLQHRERGSSQRHQELIDAKDDKQIDTITSPDDEPTIINENSKNFTNYLIETKRLAQKNAVKTELAPNGLKLFADDRNGTIPPNPKKENLDDDGKINILKTQKQNDYLSLANVEDEGEETADEIKSDAVFEEKKSFSFPTTTTYTTKSQENEAISFEVKSPKTRIVLENSDREPRLFESLPDFTVKTTGRPPLFVAPTVPSQVLFIQDTNHLDKYQSYEEKNKDADEDNNLVYRRFEMRKLPVAVKSAIIASAAILAIAVLGFFVLLISCRMRQKKRVLRKKSVFCQHSNHHLHHEPDLRSSARSTSPVMDDKHCPDQYYDGYGGRIDVHSEANRQYYLWRTLRKTFRYD